jgi:hypothetical protein
MSRAETTPGALPPGESGKEREVGGRAFDAQPRRRRARRPLARGPRASRQLLRGSPRGVLRRIPTLAWLCAVVACLNAVCWSLISPPFQVPDEPEHVAYVQDLVGNGRLPASGDGFSAEEFVALEDLHLQTVAEQPQHQTISSQAQQDKLQRDLRRAESSSEKGVGAGVAASEPPLYYALQAIPYSLGAGGTLLDRIELMRLLSALMAGLTALFTFLFVREALPRTPWAWAVGGLGVALVPLLGFMSGAVTPEPMLYAVTAALFYCLARPFRRGLTRRGAMALGALTAIGLLTKLNFLGIAPGALLGLVVLSVRAARTQRRSAYVSFAIAFAIALSPGALYVVRNLTSGAPALGFIPGAFATVHAPLAEMSYIWQLFLPRLPGMHNDFAGVFTTRQIWFDWYVGLYGWLDTTFPGWAYELALIPTGLILALCLREIIASAGALRDRAAELVVYCVIGIGLMILVGGDSYDRFPALDAEFGQARYLLPLLPALAVVLVLAARGAGRRWGPAVGAAIIMLFLAHDVFSQLQVIARFYG